MLHPSNQKLSILIILTGIDGSVSAAREKAKLSISWVIAYQKRYPSCRACRL